MPSGQPAKGFRKRQQPADIAPEQQHLYSVCEQCGTQIKTASMRKHRNHCRAQRARVPAALPPGQTQLSFGNRRPPAQEQQQENAAGASHDGPQQQPENATTDAPQQQQPENADLNNDGPQQQQQPNAGANNDGLTANQAAPAGEQHGPLAAAVAQRLAAPVVQNVDQRDSDGEDTDDWETDSSSSTDSDSSAELDAAYGSDGDDDVDLDDDTPRPQFVEKWYYEITRQIDRDYMGVADSGNLRRGRICLAKTNGGQCYCHPYTANTKYDNFFFDPPNPLMRNRRIDGPGAFQLRRVYIWYPEYFFFPIVRHLPCPNCRSPAFVTKKGWNQVRRLSLSIDHGADCGVLECPRGQRTPSRVRSHL